MEPMGTMLGSPELNKSHRVLEKPQAVPRVCSNGIGSFSLLWLQPVTGKSPTCALLHEHRVKRVPNLKPLQAKYTLLILFALALARSCDVPAREQVLNLHENTKVRC